DLCSCAHALPPPRLHCLAWQYLLGRRALVAVAIVRPPAYQANRPDAYHPYAAPLLPACSTPWQVPRPAPLAEPDGARRTAEQPAWPHRANQKSYETLQLKYPIPETDTLIAVSHEHLHRPAKHQAAPPLSLSYSVSTTAITTINVAP